MDIESNLLFGLIALELHYIDAEEFTAAGQAWVQKNSGSLAQVLRERGKLAADDCAEVEAALQRKLAWHDGNVRQCLASQRGVQGACAKWGIENPEFSRTLSVVAVPPGYAPVQTVVVQPEQRSRYTRSRVHGQGGLGRVWVARDENLHREVALKEIRPDKETNHAAWLRFVREAQVTGQLEHPNIVPVYEMGRSSGDDRPFYTMRYLRGQTLQQMVSEYHKQRAAGKAQIMDLRRLLNAFVGVCNAVAYAHSRGVIHRDLKPDNVILGDFGEVIVLDWGLAKVLGEDEKDEAAQPVKVSDDTNLRATVDGMAIGTLGYMSPEQAEGRQDLMDTRADIYGLGATLFKILTGSAPHKGADTHDVLEKIIHGETLRPRSIVPSVPAPLDAICAKAMAKQKSDRYRTAAALADDVQRWLADEPVSVYREPRHERLARWMRRHRTWTQAGAAALILVSLVSLVAAFLVDRARRSEAAALVRAEKSLIAERQALAAETAARAEATQRFKEARDAVDRSLTGVSQVLEDLPGVQSVRIELLKTADEDYERFAADRSDDPELKAATGRALLRLGDVRGLLEQWPEAESAYRRAESIFGELSADAKENLDLQLALAQSRSKLAFTAGMLGHNDEAERHYKTALTGLDAAQTQTPDASRLEFEKAAAKVNFAVFCNQSSRFEQAVSLLGEAEGEFAILVDHDSQPKHIEGLATARDTIGQVLQNLSRHQEAAAKLEDAILDFHRLTLLDDNRPQYRERLAGCRINLANALRMLGQDDLVEDTYQAAISDYLALIKARPDVPRYRESVALTRADLALLLHRQGRNAEAKVAAMSALNEAVDLVNSNSSNVRYHEAQAFDSLILGAVLCDLDEYEWADTALTTAIRKFRELVDFDPDTARYKRSLANSLHSRARLLHKLEQHEEAMQIFVEAIAEFDNSLKQHPGDAFALDAQAQCHLHMGNLLRHMGESTEAAKCYTNAQANQAELPADPEHFYNLVWLLTNCDDEKFRDPIRAVQLAEQLKQRAPKNGRYWSLLGTALLRSGKFDESMNALRVAIDLRRHESSFDWFALSMAYAKHGDSQQSQSCFDRAAANMRANNPGNIDLLKLQSEAAQLLATSRPDVGDHADTPKHSSP